MNTKNFTIVSIEGNIGSGKSTLLENLKKEFKNNNSVVFVREPVDIWETIKDNNGITMLEKFYQDQDKYSFPFQMMAYISRLQLIKEAVDENPNAIIITERSLHTDKMVFAKMLYDTKKMEDVNYQIYNKWFDMFSKEYSINKTIYVNTDPIICHNRIHKRARQGESVIPLDYLNDCHRYHESMVESDIFNDKMTLDGNIDIYENEIELQNWIKNIKVFIKPETIQPETIQPETNQPKTIQPKSNQYVLHFDGCSKGNPGISGAGAVLSLDGKEIWADSVLIGQATNNLAEYTGLLLGLNKAVEMNIKDLIVKGDSILVIKQMKGEYAVNSPNIKDLFNSAKKLEEIFDTIVFEHVYREDNKRADHLANIALNKK